MSRFVSVSLAGLLFLFVAAHDDEQSDVLVYEHVSNQWFEGPSAPVTISGDGLWAMFRGSAGVRLVSLKSGQEDPRRARGDLDSLRRAVFCGSGTLARLGQRGSAGGWFLPSTEDKPDSGIPDDAVLRCSADGRVVAYFRSSRPDELSIGHSTPYKMPGRITALAFSPDSEALYTLSFRADGTSALIRISVQTGAQTTIADDLDADPLSGSIAIAADGRSAYVPLASSGAPNNIARHQADGSRWLKLYQVDLANGSRRPVVTSDGQDNFSPTVSDGYLYWARNVIHSALALVSSQGGDARDVIADAQLPMWSPDGRRLSYIAGGWRRADWALNLESAVVNLNARGETVSRPTLIVEGYHEDFPAAWSPDGRWIAYHSHRSTSPVAEYAGAGSTDDVYLRRADDLHAPEIRLTDFGWETGPAFWSPDGRRLLFSSWERGGQPGIDKLWVLTVDPGTGRVLERTRLSLPPDIRSAQWAVWSPDGKEIAIEDNRGGEARSLWIVRSDGTQGQKLVDYRGTTYGGLDWMRTGGALVYSGLAGNTMQLFVIARGGAPKQISRDRGNLLHPRVSPDGRWIACTRLVQSQQIWRRTVD